MMKKTLYAIGDIHGMLGEMMLNLEHRGVVNSSGDWDAKEGTLVCTGDLTDRGPEGYEVMKKLYDLKEQAEKDGGKVVVTLGNHDVGFLNCAVFLSRRPDLKKLFEGILDKNEMHDRKKIFNHSNQDPAKYREARHSKTGESVNICITYSQGQMADEHREMQIFQDQISDMLFNGMNLEDLLMVCESPELIKWAVSWPAMFVEGNVLFQHCDSHRAYKYLESQAGDFEGSPLEKVNHAATMIMLNPSAFSGYSLWGVLTSGRYWEDNVKGIGQHIDYFAPGAKKVAHGHTRLFGEFLPMEYADGKAVNLDVGLAYSPQHFGKTGRMIDLTEYAG